MLHECSGEALDAFGDVTPSADAVAAEPRRFLAAAITFEEGLKYDSDVVPFDYR